MELMGIRWETRIDKILNENESNAMWHDVVECKKEGQIDVEDLNWRLIIGNTII